jgi:hypothetical protein
MESDLIQTVGDGNWVMIKEEEVERALKFSKGNKAPEPGGIPKELLRYGGKNLITFLTDGFNEILMGRDKLQEWNSGYVCCLYKKGDKKDCNNYGGISIINCIERVFSIVTKNKTKNMIKAKMSEEWAGFITGNSCLVNIFCLQQIITQQEDKNK